MSLKDLKIRWCAWRAEHLARRSVRLMMASLDLRDRGAELAQPGRGEVAEELEQRHDAFMASVRQHTRGGER